MYPDVLSIAKTAERCKEEGIPLSEKAIRNFVKSKQIPAIQTGKKSLLYFPNVRKFVESGNSDKHEQQEQSKIIPLTPKKFNNKSA